MQPLLIKVEDVSSGEACVYRREESPVLLGRGEGAGLRIGRPFVSQAHGVFTYDDARGCWTYADLESASATVLGHRPLDPEEVVAVPPSTVLRVGPLALTVLDETSAGEAAAGTEAASPFAEGRAPADTVPLPAVVVPPPEEESSSEAAAPAAVIAGGTMLLPESFSRPAPPEAPRPAPQAPAPARPRPRPRVRSIAAVAVGAMAASALITWLLVRPTPARRPVTSPAAVEWEPTRPPAPRRGLVEPPPPLEEPRHLPSRRETEAPAARIKHRARAKKVQRGANGAFVLE